jgi:hypothetical protein
VELGEQVKDTMRNVKIRDLGTGTKRERDNGTVDNGTMDK